MCYFTELPPELLNIVVLFAYGVPLEAVKHSLTLYSEIKNMSLPFFFYRDIVWDWDSRKFLKNPMVSFEPIEAFGGIVGHLFDEDAMYCFLLGLDFRRRIVRMFGTRERWLHRLSTNWCAVEPFAAYYRMVMRSSDNLLKKSGECLLHRH